MGIQVARVVAMTLALAVSSETSAQTSEPNCPIYDFPTYIAYFEPDSAKLRSDSQGSIAMSAESFLVNRVSTNRCMPSFTRIVVVGHTDTVGDDADNVSLSLRRAEVVADELVRLGIPRKVISIDAKGETQPAVTTGDNVPEPLNNRVTIDPT